MSELKKLKEENKALKERCNILEDELQVVRRNTAQEISKAQNRMGYMDRYYLGPETFEKRRYMRWMLRLVVGLRKAKSLLKNTSRD